MCCGCASVWGHIVQAQTDAEACRQKLYKIFVNMHACKENTCKRKHTLHRGEWLAYNDPCFVFFRGETTQELTSPKTCTSKKEPLYHLHKCSTMDPDAQRNVNLLMISALHRLQCSSIAWARLKLLCWGRKHICVCLTEYDFIPYPLLHIWCITIDEIGCVTVLITMC